MPLLLIWPVKTHFSTNLYSSNCSNKGPKFDLNKLIIFGDHFQKAKLLRTKKEEGNSAFKTSKWSEAYDLYTDALAIDPYNKYTNAKLYFNRATVAAKVSAGKPYGRGKARYT